MHTNHVFTLLTSPIIIWMLKLQQHHQIQHRQGQFFGQSQAAQIACIHNIEHLALGLLWLLSSALATSASHYLAHCVFASRKKGPEMWRLCHASSHTSAAQNWGFCTLRQGVRATVVYTKAHSLSKRTQLPWKQRQEMAEQLCSCCLWGIDSGMLPLWLHTGIVSSGAGQRPKLTWGQHQWGTMGKPKAAHHCLPSAAQTQPARSRGLAAQRAKAHPQCSAPQTQKCFTSQSNSYCMFLMQNTSTVIWAFWSQFYTLTWLDFSGLPIILHTLGSEDNYNMHITNSHNYCYSAIPILLVSGNILHWTTHYDNL